MTCDLCSTSETMCVTCGSRLCAEHTILGHPLITMRQLVSATVSAALRAPATLGSLLFNELPQATYCEECRENLADQRQTEQLKLMGLMLLVIMVIVALPAYLIFV